MCTTGQGDGCDLVIEDEFFGFLVEFVCLVLSGTSCGTICASDEDLNIGFSTDVSGESGYIEGLEVAKVEGFLTSLELVIEFLFEMDEISGVKGGDTDAEFWTVSGELLDKFDGEEALDFISPGVCG